MEDPHSLQPLVLLILSTKLPEHSLGTTVRVQVEGAWRAVVDPARARKHTLVATIDTLVDALLELEQMVRALVQ